MRKLNSYTFLSLNGYYKDLNEDTSWHQHGEEEAKFSETSLEAENTLLFGRTTYEMMNSFWPTPMAAEMFPKVAQGMNSAKKIVFSNTLKEAEWENTSIISGNIIEQITKLKQTEGSDMTILGSGSIVAQFSDAGLIDTYQIMIDPVALPSGHTLFNGIKATLNLKLIDSKVFGSGVILLTYEKQ
ncbi:dihydrofolate reductase family protein [uncultured Roseivirga sp.]|uniref:dihydrofolate reductase family protein n=1 Tax=uncultured Roseivirga sp. TaxID=543088 RepID=UPI0030DA59C8|tara:strand:- start:15081 stop:15635 length:555 start_codon:yes stop_codon:yes gene_type:complete